MNKFVKTITKDRIGYEFFKSLNGILNLTEREIELLVLLLNIKNEKLNQRARPKSIDCAENRKHIMMVTSITKDNLSRYIKGLKAKQILVRESGIITINKALIPLLIGGKVIQITMILKIKEDEYIQI